MKKLFLYCVALLVYHTSSAQAKDSIICKGLPAVNVNATVLSYPFSKDGLWVDSKAIKNGFRVELSDKSYKVVGFRAQLDCDECEVYFKDILGSAVTVENYPILKQVKGGEIIRMQCITIRQGRNLSSAKPFNIIIEK